MCDVTGLTPGMWACITWESKQASASFPNVVIFPLWLRNTFREMHPDSAILFLLKLLPLILAAIKGSFLQ